MIKAVFDRLQGLLQPRPAAPLVPSLVLSGGGARSSYQAGVLRYIAEAFPEAVFPIISGVSAGAINTAHLANHGGSFRQAAEHLVDSWAEIRPEMVYEPESSLNLLRGLFKFSRRSDDQALAENGTHGRRGLVHTAPLRRYLLRQLENEDGRLVGIRRNLEQGWLRAVSIATTNYTTGQTVTWVEGEDIRGWERPSRVGINTTLTVDHIMASTALPLMFPAIRIGDSWYGDGGVRLTSPLSPSVHLGADRILVLSTRYSRSRHEADEPAVIGYPPAAQILGVLMNAVFLDMLDQDAIMMQRLNDLLEDVPRRKRRGLRRIQLLVLRPSEDLGKLASQYQLKVDGALGLLTNGLGTGESQSPDWLSMLLFEEDYIHRLITIGYEDGRRQHDRIEAFLSEDSFEAMPDLHDYLYTGA